MSDLLFQETLPTSKKLHNIMQIQYEIRETHHSHFVYLSVKASTLAEEGILIPTWYRIHLIRFLWRQQLFIGIESTANEHLDSQNRDIIRRYIAYMDTIITGLIKDCRRERGSDVYLRSKIFDLYLVVEYSIGRHDYSSGDLWRRRDRGHIVERINVVKLNWEAFYRECDSRDDTWTGARYQFTLDKLSTDKWIDMAGRAVARVGNLTGSRGNAVVLDESLKEAVNTIRNPEGATAHLSIDHLGGDLYPCRTQLEWKIVSGIIIDKWRIPPCTDDVDGRIAEHSRPAKDHLPAISFGINDMAILRSSNARLNDVCINDCAMLLYSEFPPIDGRITILSTYCIAWVKDDAGDNTLWRNTKHTRYWESAIWVLPIHRRKGSHWVMCTIHLAKKEIRLFDSFASFAAWKEDIKYIDCLINRLCGLAAVYEKTSRFDNGTWVARPVLVTTTQSNGYDCGVWVLAQIAAILRGADVTNLTESDMSKFRRYLYQLAVRLPLHT